MWTHAIFDAEIGPYTTSELGLSKLVDRLEPCMVLLADRGITGVALWQQATATGAELVVAGEEQRDTSPDRGVRRWVMAR